MRYDKHIFVCTNQKEDLSKKSCGKAHGQELIQELKAQIQGANLEGNIRVQASGCLGVCKLGPAMVVYPEGIFYGAVETDFIPLFIEEHLKHNRPLKSHLLED